jgi:hypothetical protein
MKRRHLCHRPVDIRRIRVRHRLHDDRRTAADKHAADIDADGRTPRFRFKVEGEGHFGASCSKSGRARLGAAFALRWIRKPGLSTSGAGTRDDLIAARRPRHQ